MRIRLRAKNCLTTCSSTRRKLSPPPVISEDYHRASPPLDSPDFLFCAGGCIPAQFGRDSVERKCVWLLRCAMFQASGS